MLEPASNISAATPGRAKRLAWGGGALIALSFILYAALFLVPFIPLTASGKVFTSVLLVTLGEFIFCCGGLILAISVLVHYRRFLNPRTWFQHKS